MAVSNYVRIPKDHTLVVVLKDSFLMKNEDGSGNVQGFFFNYI